MTHGTNSGDAQVNTSPDTLASPRVAVVTAPLNVASVIPLQCQLAYWIAQRIDDGTFIAGMVLDSEPKIARDLGVSRNTVRLAMDFLVKHRIIARTKGIRHVITSQPRQQPVADSRNGAQYPSSGGERARIESPSASASTEMWREIDIFVPARLGDAQSHEYVRRHLTQIAADTGEFVVDVRISPLPTSTDGWRKWAAAYLPSADPPVARPAGRSGAPRH